ncbi:MAG: DUF3604 domain-containing protein [Proteobacteria bacterium]|nr:DUF3604 domain-containing protein [Pseudomonadota bacterium]
MRSTIGCALLCALILSGCSREPDAGDPAQTSTEPAPAVQGSAATDGLVSYTETRTPCADYTPDRMPLFGDVHVHTSFSFDAAANSTGATPSDAHRFARGEPIPFWPLDEAGKPIGSITIDRPLDFLAVTDHAEFLGERALCRTPDSPSYGSAFCTQYRSDQLVGMRMLGTVITTETPARVPELCGADGSLCREWAQGPWQRIVAAAEEAYDRSSACEFTSFVAYEYTGTPGTSNLHRNVIFRNGDVPDGPVSYIDAPADNLLWNQLDVACTGGCDYLTIPHNSNLANGRMAPYTAIDQTPEARRAYADHRLKREPIMEIFQHKGGSECVNGLGSILSQPDELCDVEQVRFMGREETFAVTVRQADGSIGAGQRTEVTVECEPGEVGASGMLGAGCVDKTDFIRSGLLVGLAEEAELGSNPVKLGMIASTDTHAATPGAASETNWAGHVTGESTPLERLQPGLLTSGIDGNPGGLAGVWAVENSRDAIFEAMQRREVFGTSGPRIVPRFFAGWGFTDDLCGSQDLAARGYAQGVPMGGDLPTGSAGARPTFVAYAVRDPASAQLERLQLVKGWIDAQGGQHADVIDIAGSAQAGAGHDSLCAVYSDEGFDATQPAYYYLRVVENATPRWSAHDCARVPEAQRPAVCTDGSYPSEIHEMAWTSPIWYRPKS